MALEIRTNYHWREPLHWFDIPESKREDFDYIDNPEEDGWSRFFCYRGTWYDLHEFSATQRTGWAAGMPEAFATWHGYQSDSYFSGILVRYSDDCEEIQVGTYLS
jgi:hypothetical protein